MAVDEAILQAVNDGSSPATLRFYQWSQPTISLGYFQKYQEFTGQDDEIRQLPCVRRQTGGGAILHDDELTYSLVLPLKEKTPAKNIEYMYQLVHDAFIAVLTDLGIKVGYRGGNDKGNSQRGPFFCFSRTHRLDLLLENGAKLLGSAQRRIKNAVLQHGSLILQRHFPQQDSASLAQETEKPIDLKSFIAEIAKHIGSQLHLKPVDGKLNKSEDDRRLELEEKYAGDAWNRQR